MNTEPTLLDPSADNAAMGRVVGAQARSAAGTQLPDRYTAAMSLGATMYVPAVHADIEAIVAGQRYPALKSLVLCLEDALHASDVERGLHQLEVLLGSRKRLRSANAGSSASRPAGPKLFLRPRGFEMAQAIARYPGIEGVHGMVIPKIRIDDLNRWWQLAAETGLHLMPTLEDSWIFDPLELQEFACCLAEQDQSILVAVRVGGNDLMASMRLRRLRGKTVYDSPLAWGLAQLMCQLGSRGFALSAPVFDVLDDTATLARECRLDAEFGFVGKTAIHPAQIATIERGFAVQKSELEIARKALALDASAVFRTGGMMLEPATHRAWAQRIVAQAEAYGVMEEMSDAERVEQS